MAPQGAARVGGEKSLSHTLPAPFRRFPLWWLRHHLSPYSGGTMGAGLLSQFVFMAVTAENHTTGLRPWKCTPSVAYGDVSPRESVSHDSQSPTAPYESCSLATPEGEILAALYLELLMNSNAERRENFPLRGKWCAAPKGVHFHALCTFCRECASQSKLAHSLPIKGPSF